MINYSVNVSGVAAITQHLRSCDGAYVPPLSQRVEIAQYADKLHRLATRYEAWEDNQLIGLVAAYPGTAANPEWFLSNVSVLPAMTGRDIATNLLLRLIADARAGPGSCIRLEVGRENHAAQKLYSKLGFVALDGDGPAPLCMILSLREKKL
jgi:ribosomal protein S18 acetylase RimI-like enzyme